MKDYDHIILWLDYFNKNLRRRHGRRVKKDQAISDPTVQDLSDAVKAAGFEFSEQDINGDARFPRRAYVKSGYVMVAKREGLKKSQVIDTVAEKLLQKRNRQKAGKK